MIPLNNLSLHHRSLSHQFIASLKRVMKHGTYILGPEVIAFESAFARYTNTKYAIGVSNGTDALTVSLKAVHIGPGDEVIIPAFTFVSTAFAVLQTGARPVLVDIEPTTYTIDTLQMARAITRKTKAIIPVHLYGMPCDMDMIGRLAKKYRLTVIEDAAQAHGSFYKKRPAGSIGDMGCFSFYPSKNLGALGDAGAITTNSSRLASRIRTIINLGTTKKYIHVDIGVNNRLDSLQAAFLSSELPMLNSWNARRRNIAARYTSLLKELPIELPKTQKERITNMHLYVIRTKQRAALRRHLLARGIQTGIHYPKALHEQRALHMLGYTKGAFPVSETAAKEVLSLPMYPKLTDRQIITVTSAVRSFFRQ